MKRYTGIVVFTEDLDLVMEPMFSYTWAIPVEVPNRSQLPKIAGAVFKKLRKMFDDPVPKCEIVAIMPGWRLELCSTEMADMWQRLVRDARRIHALQQAEERGAP
jgi:hypothetical protein